jgi:hypothetical protein
MTKARHYKAAVALGSLTATVALFAGLSSASAQTAPGGGSYPGSFLVPGTNTSLKIGGYAKGDLIYDFSARNGVTFDPKGIPVDPSAAHSLHGALVFHAKESRFNIETRTPTAYGELKTFIEVDFFGTANQAIGGSTGGGSAAGGIAQAGANSELTRVRHAFGTLGPLLIGQTFSNWYDPDSEVELLDGGGDAGYMRSQSARATQIRYTWVGPSGLSLAGSLENPEVTEYLNAPFTVTGGTAQTVVSTTSLGAIDRVPDVVGTVRVDQPWGHAALHGLYRDLKLIAPGAARQSKNGYGVGFTSHFNTIGKDVLKVQAIWGRGLGQFEYGSTQQSLELSGITATAITAYAPLTFGGMVAYQHWWTDQLRTNVSVGYDQIHNSTSVITSAAALAGLDKRHYTSHVNLIWSPVPQVDLGVEYIYGRRVVESGLHGNANRAQVSGKFKF